MKPGQLYFKFPNKSGYICIPLSAYGEDDALIDILVALFPNANHDCFFKTSSNKMVTRLGDLPFSNNNFVQVIPRVRAGKGGFGTLMKNQALQKRRFTDTYAAKDLSGRKMRDVKNEIKLKKWILRKTENRSKIENDPARNKPVSSDKLQHAKSIQTLTESKKFVKSLSSWNNILQESIAQGLKAAHKLQADRATSDDSNHIDDNPEKLPNILSNIASKRKLVSASESNITGSFHSNSNTSNTKALSQNNDDLGMNTSSLVKPNSTIDLNSITSLEELKAFDSEDIKNYLKSIGVKCGGTPDERVKRLWDIKCNPALLLDKKYLAPKTSNN